MSDTRTPATDKGGTAASEILERAGHRVVGRAILPDDPRRLAPFARRVLARGDVDALVATGGTGIAPRDRTVEALSPLFEKRLDGFGEVFRMLSYREVGVPGLLSRAAAGTVRGKVVFLLPGSEGAVRLGVRRLVVPLLPHAVGLLRLPAGGGVRPRGSKGRRAPTS